MPRLFDSGPQWREVIPMPSKPEDIRPEHTRFINGDALIKVVAKLQSQLIIATYTDSRCNKPVKNVEVVK